MIMANARGEKNSNVVFVAAGRKSSFFLKCCWPAAYVIIKIVDSSIIEFNSYNSVNCKAAHMALRRLKDCIAELHDSNNAVNLKETMSISAAENPNSTQQQYVKWDEVRSFLLMAEEALRAKDEATRR